MDDETTQVDPFEAHINMAIEAQDGKADETPNTETETGTEQTSDTETVEVAQPKDSESGASNSGTQPKPEQKAEEKPKQTHGPKDLTLPDGSVVKAGAERRFYEGRELARQQLQVAETKLQTATQQLTEAQNKLQSMEQSVQSLHGVGPEQLALGVRIVSDLQRDPQGTLKKLLAEAVNQGYKIEGIAGGVDMLAVQRLIDERLPSNNNQPTNEQILKEAEAEAATFFSQYPDAKPHDDLIAKVLRDHPDLSPQDAYFQLKQAFVDKGFDWSLSLEQNLQASVSVDGATNNGGNPPNPNPNPQKPLPNGGNLMNDDLKPADLADVENDMDTGDIVKAAMREAGLNI